MAWRMDVAWGRRATDETSAAVGLQQWGVGAGGGMRRWNRAAVYMGGLSDGPGTAAARYSGRVGLHVDLIVEGHRPGQAVLEGHRPGQAVLEGPACCPVVPATAMRPGRD